MVSFYPRHQQLVEWNLIIFYEHWILFLTHDSFLLSIFSVFGEKTLDDKFYHSYPITMKLVYENSTDISGGKVTLGEKVKLQVQIKPKASGKIFF